MLYFDSNGNQFSLNGATAGWAVCRHAGHVAPWRSPSGYTGTTLVANVLGDSNALSGSTFDTSGRLARSAR